MKPKLHKLAEKVFGASWRYPLARHIDANPRTVRRWANQEIEVPKVVLLYLALLIKNGITIEEKP